jgi:hypothetical protein
VSILVKRTLTFVLAPLLLALAAPGVGLGGQEADNQEAASPVPPPPESDAKRPTPDVAPQLVPMLPTIPWRHDRHAYNFTTVDTTPLPKDKEGLWVLDFAFRPIRIVTVEIPGKGRRNIHYLYYKVVNRTGAPRTFVPQFIMVNSEGKRYEDAVIPQAVPLIQNREDPTIPVRGAVNIMGVIPESTKKGVDDAVFGVATWDDWDAKADRYSIYIRGLSDGYKEVPDPNGEGKPTVRYKTLRLDFIRRGDERNISEKEIELADPPYDWTYW